MEENRMLDLLNGVAAALTQATGQDWQVNAAAAGWPLLVRQADGLTIHAYLPYRERNKVAFSGSPQDHLRQHLLLRESAPTIKVSLTKAPVQMVKDIQRRLLPEWETLYQALLVRTAEADQTQVRVEDTIGRLTGQAPRYMRRATNSNHEPVNAVEINSLGEGYGKIAVRESSDGEMVVDIDLRSIPADAVLGLLEAYNQVMESRSVRRNP